MGRKAGHLGLGIGKAAGATLTLILEEFADHRIRLKSLVDTLAGAIIKRLNQGRRDGVAILAEGVVLGIDPEDLAGLDEVERDSHGNVRIAEVNIGEILKTQVQARLKTLGLSPTIVAKNIGYELRCADPIPSDLEYNARSRLLRGALRDGGRERSDDLDAGRALRADPVPANGRIRRPGRPASDWST